MKKTYKSIVTLLLAAVIFMGGIASLVCLQKTTRSQELTAEQLLEEVRTNPAVAAAIALDMNTRTQLY